MIAPVRHYKGNRQPPLFDTISADDSTLFDAIPTGSSITFYMRNALTSTLKVNGAAAVLTSEPLNQVRYDWAATDVDTAGYYVGWWRVTLPSAQFEESPEFLVIIDDHVPVGNEYVSAEELKTTRAIRETYADADVQLAVSAASRAVDGITRRSFYLGASETRKFTAISPDFCGIDDAATITAVSVSGAAIVADTNYVTEGVAPFTQLRSFNGYVFPQYLTNAVSVTGTFGWPSIPPAIKAATSVLAGRLLQLMREGSMVSAGFDGSAIAIGLMDRNVAGLLDPYKRNALEQ